MRLVMHSLSWCFAMTAGFSGCALTVGAAASSTLQALAIAKDFIIRPFMRSSLVAIRADRKGAESPFNVGVAPTFR
jgi:hypothetical protein